MNSSKLTQTTNNTETSSHTTPQEQVTSTDTPGGATGPITKAISARRSHRRHWRILECIAMIILDAILVIISFRLAYHLRYDTFFNNQLLETFRYNLLGIENNAHTTLKITPDALHPSRISNPLKSALLLV